MRAAGCSLLSPGSESADSVNYVANKYHANGLARTGVPAVDLHHERESGRACVCVAARHEKTAAPATTPTKFCGAESNSRNGPQSGQPPRQENRRCRCTNKVR